MDDQPSKSIQDRLLCVKNLGRKEADQLFESIVAELEQQIAFLKSKFKTEEAFNEFLAMLGGKNKTAH
ncbi:MAG: hypothetical protein LBI10_09915 [Deltaproteobacteria bacterium]|jgi:hypothetical protein|nr:hypothetical protein [Deltaproteobacteria bacterium]